MILHVRTQEVLDRVGFPSAAGRGPAAARGRRPRLRQAHRQLGPRRIDSPYPHPVIIGQNRTQHLLLDQLQARGVESSGTPKRWLRDGRMADGASARPSRRRQRERGDDPRPLCRRLRGIQQPRAQGAQFTFEGDRYSGEQFIQADCRIRWALPKGRSYLFLTADGYMMVIEFPDDVVRIFISLPDATDSAGAAGRGAANSERSKRPTRSRRWKRSATPRAAVGLRVRTVRSDVAGALSHIAPLRQPLLRAARSSAAMPAMCTCPSAARA